MKATGLALASLVLSLLLIAPAQAEGRGWWPFGSDEESVPNSSDDDIPDATSEVVAPKTPTAAKRSAKPAAKQPSVFTRMGTSTRNFFTRTGEVLTPNKSKSKTTSQYPRWKPGSSTHKPAKKSNQRTAAKQEGGSWFSSWFRDDEPQTPQTMHDFMELERPH